MHGVWRPVCTKENIYATVALRYSEREICYIIVFGGDYKVRQKYMGHGSLGARN
jgi:hypothetical protein